MIWAGGKFQEPPCPPQAKWNTKDNLKCLLRTDVTRTLKAHYLHTQNPRLILSIWSYKHHLVTLVTFSTAGSEHWTSPSSGLSIAMRNNKQTNKTLPYIWGVREIDKRAGTHVLDMLCIWKSPSSNSGTTTMVLLLPAISGPSSNIMSTLPE